MSTNHLGNTQPAIDQEEHTHISGVGGKKVFVVDNAGNQIISFSSATIAYQPFSYYRQSSLASGYTFHGFCIPGSNPTTANFKIQREELDRGLVLFAGGTGAFLHTWSAASLASINYS